MRKTAFILMSLLAITAMAQTKGNFEVRDFDSFKLHIYYTNDVMADASYIIEGDNALVTLEEPLFKDNVTEFGAYLSTHLYTLMYQPNFSGLIHIQRYVI